jgi:hypothetical protein
VKCSTGLSTTSEHCQGESGEMAGEKSASSTEKRRRKTVPGLRALRRAKKKIKLKMTSVAVRCGSTVQGCCGAEPWEV